MAASVRCSTTFVDMMNIILHKILSSGTVAARVDMEEVLLEVVQESKGRMDSTNIIRRPLMNSTRPLRQTTEDSILMFRHLVGIALLQEVSVTMDALVRHSQRRIPSNTLVVVVVVVVQVITAAYLTCLGVRNLATRDRVQALEFTWASKAVMKTQLAAMAIPRKCLGAQVLHSDNLVDVLDQPQMLPAEEFYHPLVRIRANRATAVIWAISCMASKDRSMVAVQGVWAATTKLEVKITKLADTELMAQDMVGTTTATAIVVDGVPAMGTIDSFHRFSRVLSLRIAAAHLGCFLALFSRKIGKVLIGRTAKRVTNLRWRL